MTNADDGIKIVSLLPGIANSVAGAPKVKYWFSRVGFDEAGDPAVFIRAVLDDSVPDSDWTNEKLSPITNAIREGLPKAGINRWAYVTYARDSGMKAAG